MLTVHLAVTWFMTGVIWFVQLVHYPLFAAAAGPSFAAYHRRHLALVTWVVAPAMLVELATGLLLAWAPPPELSPWTTTAGLVLLAIIWLSTALVRVIVTPFACGSIRNSVMPSRLSTSPEVRADTMSRSATCPSITCSFLPLSLYLPALPVARVAILNGA